MTLRSLCNLFKRIASVGTVGVKVVFADTIVFCVKVKLVGTISVNSWYGSLHLFSLFFFSVVRTLECASSASLTSL